MKFVTFYILTFLIVWGVAGGGEFSQQDLHYIAERLNPLECSKLLKDIPVNRKNERKHEPDFHELSDYWESETSRKECFESLYECNEKGKNGGCTKKWLVSTLYKFGRADLAAGLKKRWKKPEIKKDKSKKKNKAKQTKSVRPGGGTSYKRNKTNQSDTAKSIVKSEHRWASNIFESEPQAEKIFFDDSFVIFVAAGSFLILGFLATILFVAYRRACRCFKNYEEYHLQKEKKPPLHEQLEKDLDVCTTAITNLRKKPNQVGKCTKFALESDKMDSADKELSENFPDTLLAQRDEKEFLESVREQEAKECKAENKKSKRKMSPCARIKRFIDSQKRSLRSEKERQSKKRRRKNCHEKKYEKKENVGKISVQDEKGSNRYVRRNIKTYSSPRNCERRRKILQANRKTFHRSKSINCTCDMCRLFNVKDEEKCSD